MKNLVLVFAAVVASVLVQSAEAQCCRPVRCGLNRIANRACCVAQNVQQRTCCVVQQTCCAVQNAGCRTRNVLSNIRDHFRGNNCANGCCGDSCGGSEVIAPPEGSTPATPPEVVPVPSDTILLPPPTQSGGSTVRVN